MVADPRGIVDRESLEAGASIKKDCIHHKGEGDRKRAHEMVERREVKLNG